jgi:hypothetical protein
MTVFTLAKTDTYKTSECKQKLKLPILLKDVTKIHIGSRKVQQIVQTTDKEIVRNLTESDSSSQDQHRLKYKLPVTHSPPIDVKHVKHL